jgi:uncharacterized MAPEG superfamily protein
MSTELFMLSMAGGFILLLTLLQGTRNILVLGPVTAAGNQHDIAPWAGWNDRLNRAIKNQIEGIVIFAPILLAVEFANFTNETTALGAQIFVFARVVHAIVYTIGIPWFRTTAWAAGVAGIVLVASPIIG